MGPEAKWSILCSCLHNYLVKKHPYAPCKYKQCGRFYLQAVICPPLNLDLLYVTDYTNANVFWGLFLNSFVLFIIMISRTATCLNCYSFIDNFHILGNIFHFLLYKNVFDYCTFMLMFYHLSEEYVSLLFMLFFMSFNE